MSPADDPEMASLLSWVEAELERINNTFHQRSDQPNNGSKEETHGSRTQGA
jgi:hypothetical protein